jgi:C4-dicarboxylate-specific signal transduction histidine kinase
MTHEIGEFAASRSGDPEWIDVNAMVRGVCAFLSHDRRLASTPIAFGPGDGLPACRAVPDRLLEVLMDLLPRIASAGGSDAPAGGRVLVTTHAQGDRVGVTLQREAAGGSAPIDLAAALDEDALAHARGRIVDMGGALTVSADAAVLALTAAPTESTPDGARGRA